jgi:hypothetical protein
MVIQMVIHNMINFSSKINRNIYLNNFSLKIIEIEFDPNLI